MLTEKQLNYICPAFRGPRLTMLVTKINKVTSLYGLNTPDILEDFIPNLLLECAEFNKFEENLNYSPARLMQVWPRRFPDMLTAKQYAYQKEKLANYVYGGRRDLGNDKPGDGWHFRGSGPIQATGKGIITKFAVFYNAQFGTKYTPHEVAEMMRDHIHIEMGLHFACWFFAIAKDLEQPAIDDKMQLIRTRINGALHGFDRILIYHQRCKKILYT